MKIHQVCSVLTLFPSIMQLFKIRYSEFLISIRLDPIISLFYSFIKPFLRTIILSANTLITYKLVI